MFGQFLVLYMKGLSRDRFFSETLGLHLKCFTITFQENKGVENKKFSLDILNECFSVGDLNWLNFLNHVFKDRFQRRKIRPCQTSWMEPF